MNFRLSSRFSTRTGLSNLSKSYIGRTLQVLITRKREPLSISGYTNHFLRQFSLLGSIVWDFMKGVWALRPVGSCVTVFGSARLREPGDEYRLARVLGAALAARGLTIMTGGGPGLMEAVSRGARESGGRVVGCRIRLSVEQSVKVQLDCHATFRYFFIRKMMMMRNACGFIVLPGGLGTLDELFEVLTLMQMKKLNERPIVFLGASYWKPLFGFINSMERCGTIRTDEMALIRRLVLFTDDVQLAVAYVEGQAGSASQPAAAEKPERAMSPEKIEATRRKYPVRPDTIQPSSSDAA
jgi:uncharacterized protein (TIGR00730 family)